MWIVLASALAYEPHVAGGIGAAATAQGSNLLAVPGVGVAGALEVTELIKPIPWLGVGVDTIVGYYPSRCDTCESWIYFRQGLGPVFRTRRGLIHAGARYGIGTISLPRQTKVRPFIKSVAILPAGDLDFRVGIYGEGLPTELGLTLELGWWLDKGQFRVSRAAKKVRPPPPPPPPDPAPTAPKPEPEPAPPNPYGPKPDPVPNPYAPKPDPDAEPEPEPEPSPEPE